MELDSPCRGVLLPKVIGNNIGARRTASRATVVHPRTNHTE